MKGEVLTVSACGEHLFSKEVRTNIRLIKGFGVEGDAHMGAKVKHRSRVARNPNQPNLRQVHLIHAELLTELNQRGFDVSPGSIGENILTEGIQLLDLPTGTCLRIGKSATIKVTGLRNPCWQLDNFQSGLLKAVLDQDENSNIIRKSGIMAIVLKSGDVWPGDEIEVDFPSKPHQRLEPV